MNYVVMPNCTCDLYDAANNPVSGVPRQKGNLQKDKRDAQTLTALLQGRGRPENEHTKLYRVRINLLPNGIVPKVDDKIFIATHSSNKTLRGWYTIWQEPEQTAGSLPTQILSLHQEF